MSLGLVLLFSIATYTMNEVNAAANYKTKFEICPDGICGVTKCRNGGKGCIIENQTPCEMSSCGTE